MLALIALHAVAAGVAPALVAAWGRRAFWVLAAVPAVAFTWIATQTGTVSGAGATDVTESARWVGSLGMSLSFRLTGLSWLMALLVTGVGALVLLYCANYFRPRDAHLGRFAGLLTAFAGAMLGLVLADDLLVLYVFWELTTVLSYLLIGHNPERKANRRAAMHALIVTTAGGLAMLVGMVVLGADAGTFRVSRLLSDPPSGTAVTVALVLVLAGAATKSALVPFHFWLPGAMAAPTPVSAYLHAAAMVKAGVFLVALFAPPFAGTVPWRLVLLTLGAVTMLLGALRALRQDDLKLLLAWGTVSQLGLLTLLVGAGTRNAALAGVAMLVAHALFKSALFLVVGIVDRVTGTRDLRELSGLGRARPVLAAVAVAAAASMAGLPPLTGFVAKETGYTAMVDIAETGAGTGVGPLAGWALVATLTAGSALTAAYSARFVWGAFARKPGVAGIAARSSPPVFVVAPAVLAATGLVLGFAGHAETAALAAYTHLFPESDHPTSLALWHGVGLPLALSVSALAAGAVLFARRAAVGRVQDRLRLPLDAERVYRRLMRQIDRLAVEVTGATQRGSLPLYLGVIFLVLIVVPGGSLLVGGFPDVEIGGWDNGAQVVVGTVMAGTALLAARSQRRLQAVVLAGVTGYGMAMLFMIHGAPDVALTQVLVETVTLVIFVLVLRRLPKNFSERPLTGARWWRVGIAAGVGVVTATLTLVATTARNAAPESNRFPEPAVSYGGGHNIVNVILVDIRAWDTMGEISVLVVAATGVASMIFLITGRAGRWQHDDAGTSAQQSAAPTQRRRGPGWLRAGPTLEPDRRSILFEVVTRLGFHVIVILSVYLLFTGHNAPGGGFAGGLVAGLALMVRYLAGGRHELDEAAPVDAGLVLGIGLLVATGTGLVPLAIGGDVLQSAIVDVEVPLIGHVHFATSLFFDIGVYLVVVGLMLDVLRSLGGGIDAHLDDGDDDAVPDRDVTAGSVRIAGEESR